MEKALTAWQVAEDALVLDDYAKRKVAEISRELGRPVPEVPTDILRQRHPEQMAPPKGKYSP